MTGQQEIREIEEIEERLLENGVSFNQMAESYANFLLQLVRGERLIEIANNRERKVVDAYLRQALNVDNSMLSEYSQKEICSKLWRLEKKTRKSRSGFSALIRCVICCLGTEEQWLQDDVDEKNPLYLYFFFLKKIDSSLVDDFFFYFRRL